MENNEKTPRHNDEDKCEVCWKQPPTCIALIRCAHSRSFCERCIKSCISNGHRYCPKCRTPFPIKDYLEEIKTNTSSIDNAFLNINYRPASSQRQSTVGYVVDNILVSCSIGLLVGLIIYPTIV
ncbi:unnamed protein product [Rotaria magnacalcarata]|uniref:RING-type domain-containing protein n=1 Tax=Rotaria magnacalcarata TaxID=392030 RepID=A0A816EWH2_9BILA|nr:unnamed protein product [Rotaria magnacalcarata]CAF1658595.1 unnamed protein product [Rotaria magnacalcarata]CAF2113014.1 unnamed protein product [Rotaria magnacalcarata]CAF4969755.1 unnamed protein product [Rotaria magnacalcarata]CAF5079243.1 unnamed protein product [Rotaria magnacalcarata]